MSGGDLSANTADYDGGGILVGGGSLTLNGGTITYNTAGNDGGGIYVVQPSAGANVYSNLFIPAGSTVSFSGNIASRVAVATSLPTIGDRAGTIVSTSIDGWTLTGETKRLVDEFAQIPGNDVRSLIVFNNYDINYFATAFSFEVSFEMNGGTPVIEPIIVLEGENVSRPSDPTKAGYIFAEWFIDLTFTQAYDFSDPVTQNITLYARWSFVVSGTVTNGTNGLSGASIEYTGGASAGPVTTGTDGTYSILAYEGDTVEITNVTLTNYVLEPQDQVPVSRTESDTAVNFVMRLSSGPGVQYTITATADSGATITPSGNISVTGGTDQRFDFSAIAGNTISSVLVDGIRLSSEEVASGTYTFRNVLSNHLIEVITGEPVVLDITISSGSGHAEYSINGAAFVEYTSTVTLPYNASVTVRAVADEGYEFRAWWNGDIMYPDSEVLFPNVNTSLYLEVYFDDAPYGPQSGDNTLWYILVIILIAGILIWFILFYYRRYYDVVLTVSGTVVSEDRAHRKSEYNFVIEVAHGAVSYLIGEDEKQIGPKTLLPNQDGSYTIPAEDVIGRIEIKA
jgi:uncharacterized repeat protein (TIGR02543 family)